MEIEELQASVRDFPSSPGVYSMLDADGSTLYVGKARDLRKRVSSYFRKSGLSLRIVSMMRQVQDIAVTVTHTENEALLLENNLIKSLRPRYNILLRDDKSYPYIRLSSHKFPQVSFYRGTRKEKEKATYFGPYPSASAVRESLNLLQKLFRVRQCQDTFFKNRSRPCLQYQIKRCSAPCVGLIDAASYQEDIRHTVMFLQGRSRAIVDELVEKMEQASAELDYETAAHYRDQIAALGRIQETQHVSAQHGDRDVLAVAIENGIACVTVSFIRGGRNLGSKSFFPKISPDTGVSDVLSAFLTQYYPNKSLPEEILLSTDIEDKAMFERAFTQASGRAVKIFSSVRGVRRSLVRMAEMNAEYALQRQLLSKSNLRQQFEALRDQLDLEAVPERIECFDISHMSGEATVASCVVFDTEGAVKSDYRRFNIKDVPAGDDYAAMEQAIARRYRRVKEGEGRLPDLLLIDGGKGQLKKAEGVLSEFQIADVVMIAVAKGKERKPGREQLFLSSRRQPTILPSNSPALHLIQRVRDEAHRFAISGHRQQRGKKRTRSPLEQIPGIGNKRRQTLLKNLGGLQQVARAGVEDLARIPGISPALARRIYDAFH